MSAARALLSWYDAPMGVRSVADNYPAAMADYKRRRNFVFGAAATGVPAVLLIGMPLDRVLHSAMPSAVVGLAMLVVLFRAGDRFRKWRCPGCGETFHQKGMTGNAFARRCMHCGLAKRPSPARA